jgi:cytochrome b561
MINTKDSYGRVSKSLHWLVAVLVITMVLGLFYIDLIPKSYKGTFFFFHKATGVLVLFLMLFRIAWGIETVKPSLPLSMPLIEKILARGVQHLLIFLVIVMTLSGWIMATAAGKPPTLYGLFSMPLPFIPGSKTLAKQMSDLHYLTGWSIFVLLCLHMLGGLKHHFFNKDNVLKSMI